MKLSRLKQICESNSTDDFLRNHVGHNVTNKVVLDKLLIDKDNLYKGTLYRVVSVPIEKVFKDRYLISIKEVLSNLDKNIRRDNCFHSWSKSLIGVKHFQNKLEPSVPSVFVILKAEGEGLDLNKLVQKRGLEDEFSSYTQDEEVLSSITEFTIAYINGYDVNKVSSLIDKNRLPVAKIGSEYNKPPVSFSTLMSKIGAEKSKDDYVLKVALNTDIIFRQVDIGIIDATVSSNVSSLDTFTWVLDATIESLVEFLIYIKDEEGIQ